MTRNQTNLNLVPLHRWHYICCNHFIRIKASRDYKSKGNYYHQLGIRRNPTLPCHISITQAIYSV